MKWQICVILALAGLSVSSRAAAETVSVPCEEFVRVTGGRLACDKIPTLKMPREKWEQEKAAARARADADRPPWERDSKPAEAKPRQKTLAETDPCSLPPWKREGEVKCK